MATSAAETNDGAWFDDDLPTDDFENDKHLQQIAAKFENDLNITPDTDLVVDPSENIPQDSDSSNSSSFKDQDDVSNSSDETSKPTTQTKNNDTRKSHESTLSPNVNNGHYKTSPTVDTKSSKRKKQEADKSRDSSDKDSLKSEQGCSPVGGKNPLRMLRKLTKFDKSKRKSDFRSSFAMVTVDRLPQVFVVKYLGHRDVSGVSGLHHVRKPVDEMVSKIRSKLDAKEELDLPLLYVIVSSKGLDLREHKSNKVKGTAPLGVIPLNFISYGVQDIKYWRVFTCIIVRALSWQSRSATCHAFLCDSAHSGRKMALALGVAFKEYAQKLQSSGRNGNFQVELRPPDELADAIHEYEV